MKRLDTYILREGAAPFLFGLLLYSALAIVGAALPRLQWVVGAPLGGLFAWLGLQLPAALIQALPIALLVGALLACGRLSASSELLAFEAGGVALRRIAVVFVGAGLAAAILALACNQLVLPATQARAGSVYGRLARGNPAWLVGRNIPLGDFSLTFQGIDRSSGDLLGVRIEAWQGDRLSVFVASHARFVPGGLQLFDYQFNVLDFAALGLPRSEPEALLRGLVKLDNRARRPTQSYTLTTSQGLDDLLAGFGAGALPDSSSITEAYRNAFDASLGAKGRRDALVELHRKLAEPFANLALLLAAAPLALLYARSRAVAFGLALGVTLAWYVLFTFGQLLAQAGVLPAWLGLWAANLALAAAGLGLALRRMARS